MARRDALLKLHKRLIARRDSLRQLLAGDLSDLRSKREHQSGDAADVAFGTGTDEILSKLAEIEARELAQLERAIKRIEEGTYGLCEVCDKRIPVARLNALPYSTTCIECQREMERSPYGHSAHRGGWDKVFDAENAFTDRNVNLNDLEMDLPSSR